MCQSAKWTWVDGVANPVQKFALRLRSTQVAEVNELAHDGSNMSQTRVIQADSLHGLKCRKQMYTNHFVGMNKVEQFSLRPQRHTRLAGRGHSTDGWRCLTLLSEVLRNMRVKAGRGHSRPLVVPNVAFWSCKKLAPNPAAGPGEAGRKLVVPGRRSVVFLWRPPPAGVGGYSNNHTHT